MFESLDAKFDVEAEVPEGEYTIEDESLGTSLVPHEEPLPPEVLSDEEVARKALRNALEKGGVALDGIARIAEDSESARAYEVVAQMIKTISDSSKDLLTLQKIKKDIAGTKTKSVESGPRTQNNLFVGTTAEFLKELNRRKAEEIPAQPSE